MQTRHIQSGAWFAALVVAGWSANACAAVQTRVVEYQDGETQLEGFLAYDDAMAGQRPGVIVAHEWMGLGDYAKHRAEQLAGLGYLAFAADLYGKGVRPKDHAEAAKLSGMYRSDRALLRSRMHAALEALKREELTDPTRIAAIGYCFGGTAVLELARSGAAIDGVVSFHGVLDTPHPEEARNITARVLVLSGEADPYVTHEQVAAFEQEMKDANVDYTVIRYPGAVHSFTVPGAGNDPSTGAAYNSDADKQSWEAMLKFFGEIFAHSEMRNIG